MTNEERLYDTILQLDSSKEIIGWQLKLDPRQSDLDFFGLRQTNRNYALAELQWYMQYSEDVSEIEKLAKIWSTVKSDKNEVNSNYGRLAFSEYNGSQFDKAINELKQNKDSRRAVMVYMGPDIWVKYNRDNMNDFICTFNAHLFIRDDKLIYIVNQRSCDFIYGFFNDFFWHCYVYKRAYEELFKVYPELDKSDMIYNADTLHIYPRHYEKISQIAEKIKEKRG